MKIVGNISRGVIMVAVIDWARKVSRHLSSGSPLGCACVV
jgi:hypothetical protein